MDENKKDEIVADLKQEGLDLAEDVTKESIEHVFEFAIKAINKYGNAVLKAAIPLLQTAGQRQCLVFPQPLKQSQTP